MARHPNDLYIPSYINTWFVCMFGSWILMDVFTSHDPSWWKFPTAFAIGLTMGFIDWRQRRKTMPKSPADAAKTAEEAEKPVEQSK